MPRSIDSLLFTFLLVFSVSVKAECSGIKDMIVELLYVVLNFTLVGSILVLIYDFIKKTD